MDASQASKGAVVVKRRYVTTCDACGTLRFGEWIEVGAVSICPACIDSDPLTDDERATLAERRKGSS